MFNVISWLINFFSSNATLQNAINVVLTLSWMYSTRTINQINSFTQCNILPNFSFSWNWSSSTNFLFFKWVDNTWLSDVWISDKTDTDVLFVSMKNIKLSEQVYEGTFTEWIWDWCFICDCGVLLWQILNPFFQCPNWN